MAKNVDAKVVHGDLRELDASEGEAVASMQGDGEAIRLLQANLHAARRAMVAHADSDVAKFHVKASPNELHVVKSDK